MAHPDSFHLTRAFSGVKFLPPGLHLITWSPPASSTPGPSSIPLRSARLRFFNPKERTVLAYDKATETVPLPVAGASDIEVISDDHLKSLDKELAPYPFDRLDTWKHLTGHISKEVVDGVLGESGRVDGMMQAVGEDDEVEAKVETQSFEGERTMRFPRFRLKRSWRDGAVGEEITRYARDKSWLLGHAVTTSLSSGSSGNGLNRLADAAQDPKGFLGHLELAFILELYLSSYSALLVYKRLLKLFCRSSHILVSAADYLQIDDADSAVRQAYTALIDTLAAQLTALPDSAFETELPEMDLFYLDEIEVLRTNLAAAHGGWTTSEQAGLDRAWSQLRAVAREKFGWQVGALSYPIELEEDEEYEQGEYAPVIVES